MVHPAELLRVFSEDKEQSGIVNNISLLILINQWERG
jgi:hypothetical protein